MRPNDIDKILKDAFVNENSEPKSELWENIVADLDKPNQPKSYFFPKIIGVLALLGIVSCLYYFNNNSNQIANNNTDKKQDIYQNNTHSQTKNDIESDKKDFTLNNIKKLETSDKVFENQKISTDKTSTKKNRYLNTNEIYNPSIKKSENIKSITNNVKNENELNYLHNHKVDENINISNNLPENKLNQNTEDNYLINTPFNISKINLLNKFKTNFSSDNINLSKFDYSNFLSKAKNQGVNKNQTMFNSKSNNSDFEKKWWFGLGISFVRNYNTAKVDASNQKLIHTDFWAERKTLSGNGNGIAFNTTFNYYFYKNFSFETGFEYMMRKEQIRADNFSYDVPYRDPNSQEIVGYNKIIIYLVEYNQATSKYDTLGQYNVGVSHSLSKDNYYHVFSVPLRLNKDFWISNNTRIKTGLGANVSYFNSNKRTYLDYIQTEKMVSNKKEHLINVNVHGLVGLYTNFNNIGEIGIYTILGRHLKDWTPDTKQYKITMSDVQIGLSYRMPIGK